MQAVAGFLQIFPRPSRRAAHSAPGRTHLARQLQRQHVFLAHQSHRRSDLTDYARGLAHQSLTDTDYDAPPPSSSSSSSSLSSPSSSSALSNPFNHSQTALSLASARTRTPRQSAHPKPQTYPPLPPAKPLLQEAQELHAEWQSLHYLCFRPTRELPHSDDEGVIAEQEHEFDDSDSDDFEHLQKTKEYGNSESIHSLGPSHHNTSQIQFQNQRQRRKSRQHSTRRRTVSLPTGATHSDPSILSISSSMATSMTFASPPLSSANHPGMSRNTTLSASANDTQHKDICSTNIPSQNSSCKLSDVDTRDNQTSSPSQFSSKSASSVASEPNDERPSFQGLAAIDSPGRAFATDTIRRREENLSPRVPHVAPAESTNLWALQLSQPELLSEVPPDLNENWFVMAVPRSHRVLVISSNGKTVARLSDGQVLCIFDSNLPDGNPRIRRNGDYCIIDCLYSIHTKTFYVLDIMCWKGVSYYNTEASFRFFWMREKVMEAEIFRVSSSNSIPFQIVDVFPATCDHISEVLDSCPQALVFYHKDGHYVMGRTPLTCYLDVSEISTFFYMKFVPS
eukprot:TRINITY_DN6231_c0_g1_i1.p1 TRINITY_DN6231_c0_g1~~TRINITY_DN6231_c0_g1_i1.p1  ORF type:complete len:566 (+),score=92.87 TRINITY_DN6231_c0_g1_i1:50-1747(+)